MYASAPIVQIHEVVSYDFSIFITNVSKMIGIDFALIFMFVFIHQGHNPGHHHSGKDGVTCADPACNMGNRSAPADPSSSPYDGELVGINAVRDGTNLSGQDEVLKIATSGSGLSDLFVMFNKPNRGELRGPR
jgi:hypothetical protein